MPLIRAIADLEKMTKRNPDLIPTLYARALEDERDGLKTFRTLSPEETRKYRHAIRMMWLDYEEGLCPRSISA